MTDDRERWRLRLRRCRERIGRSRRRLRVDRTHRLHSRKPAAPVHVIVVPKRHIESLGELRREDAELVIDVLLGFEDWGREQNLRSWRLVSNYGKAAGQRVRHLSFPLPRRTRLQLAAGVRRYTPQ